MIYTNMSNTYTKMNEEQIYQILRNAIFNADLPPGTQLIESSLAEAFGVSRTPIRAVLQRLKYDSLVEIIPHRGAFVYCPTPEESEQIFFVRQILEPEAAALAAIHATPEQLKVMEEMLKKEKECYEQNEHHKALPFIEQFHMTIIEASGNPYLVECLRRIISLTHIILTFYDVSHTHSCDVYEEHEALYKAICAHDANRAKQLTHLHIPSIVRDIDFSKKFNGSLSIHEIIKKYTR